MHAWKRTLIRVCLARPDLPHDSLSNIHYLHWLHTHTHKQTPSKRTDCSWCSEMCCAQRDRKQPWDRDKWEFLGLYKECVLQDGTTDSVLNTTGGKLCQDHANLAVLPLSVNQYWNKVQHSSKRSVRFFFYNLKLSFSKDALHWSKVAVKTCIMLQKIAISNKWHSFEYSINQRTQKKAKYQCFHKK